VFIKCHRKTAPTDIPRQDFLFFGCGKAVFDFKLVQQVDCRHIVTELFFCPADTDGVIGNTEIMTVCGRSFCFFFGW
jgi:hypothetical protein